MDSHRSISSKGIALASLVVPAGVTVWVVLWNFGFMASIVSFAIAYGAIWLYKTQTNGEVSKSAAFALLALIILGVVLAFIAGMVADAWLFYSKEFADASLWSAEFWQFCLDNLTSVELWASYGMDLAIAIVFALLGAGYELYRLFVPEKTVAEKTA